jgi:hypothetical protein
VYKKWRIRTTKFNLTTNINRMKKLNNTTEDRHFLYTLLSAGSFPKATFSLGCFTSELASSLTTIDYVGEVTEIDLESGYCNWKNEKGHQMPCVNINCITLH